MNIGIDVTRAAEENRTGVENYTFSLVEALKKDKRLTSGEHEVVLYSKESLTGTLGNLPNGWSNKVLRWPPKRLWTQGRLSLEMYFHAPDVLFIPGHVPPVYSPKKTLVTIHDIAAARHPMAYNRFEQWYSMWTVKRAIKKKMNIIVPTQFVKDEIDDVFPLEQKHITVIPHGIETVESSVKDTTVAEKYGITKPYIISVGRIEEKKNTRRLVEAFTLCRQQLNKDYQLVLVGKPGHGYEHALEAIEESPYKDDIIHPGWIKNNDMQALLSNASVFAFPSLYEGFGLPILEAYQANVPVVTTKGGAMQEIGENAATYVNPFSEKSIAKGIISLCKNKEKQEAQKHKGKIIASQYTWTACARKTADLILGMSK